MCSRRCLVNIAEKPSSAIKFLTGSLMGEVFPFDKPTITIGSDPGNDIIVRNDTSIAAFHVRMLWQNGALRIEKHPQGGKVRVNRRPFDQGVVPPEALIELGDEICCLVT